MINSSTIVEQIGGKRESCWLIVGKAREELIGGGRRAKRLGADGRTHVVELEGGGKRGLNQF